LFSKRGWTKEVVGRVQRPGAAADGPFTANHEPGSVER